jgi:hypothetical protein
MGKSTWVLYRTQGLFPTYCRWSVLLWLLQVLPSPSRGWRLDRWARSLPKDAFVGHDRYSGKVFETMKLCTKLCCFREINLVCNIFFWTPMDVIRMPLVKCYNEWCVVLNHYDLGLYVESCLKSSRFPDYRDYGSLSIGIWSLRWLFLYLRSYNLVGSVTNLIIFCQMCLNTTFILNLLILPPML